MNDVAKGPEADSWAPQLPRPSTIITFDGTFGGQSTKQPTIFRCPNPECFESNLDRFFDFESDQPLCPKCGLGPPHVAKRALIHLLVRDNKGPIVGSMGLRYKLLCDPKRTHLATETNGEGATGDVACANCPGCMKIVGDKIFRSGQTLSVKPL